MGNKRMLALAGSVVAAVAIGVFPARRHAPLEANPQAGPGPEKGQEKDHAAVEASSRAFSKAVAAGDAKAAAAFWTERGELHDAAGDVLRGRDAIEKAFAEFF